MARSRSESRAGLAESVTLTPVAYDDERAAAALSKVELSGVPASAKALLRGATGSSPDLARLVDRHSAILPDMLTGVPEETFDSICGSLTAAIGAEMQISAVGEALRRAKSQAALLIALADLGGVWDLGEVTGALTKLADLAVTVGAKWLLRQAIVAGNLPALSLEDVDDGGALVILAMGKMGACELNYSSDIDLIALFDDTRFSGDDLLEARQRYVRITRDLVKLLSENTAHGYVFRTDLRLRPAPSTTPVCMAMSAAERYYESVGRTWERAAHIKARPLVDVEAGKRYLEDLTPFVWRRHLDYAAIEDTQGLIEKIRMQKAQFTVGAVPGQDLKLGPGGIREIEFFAQTRQLIMGGRDPSLRLPTTLGALQALEAAGWISADVRAVMSEDYTALRTIEHRLQMIEDAQTHAVPRHPEGRARLAALCGYDDLGSFEADLVARLERVHKTCGDFFSNKRTESVESTAATTSEAALAEAGFERPGDAARRIAGWGQAGIAATRSERAQALFARLEPQIISRLSRAAQPDQALAHFDRFLSGLPAGVQVFSLFTANPQLLDLIVEICAAAPRLASYLGRHPQTLDAVVQRDFWQPLPGLEILMADLEIRLRRVDGYEAVLDETRRWAREHWFRAGVHVLRGICDHREAGIAFTHIAETFIAALLPHVTRDFATRHGSPPGDGLVVLAMGKLGSGEMTAGSDLDLITIYDGGDAPSEGPRPLPPSTYYPRLTQALIAALTAPTAEGTLYEVDMRLRPSGRSGPVAVARTAFERYQREEAWVWEHMALSRSRVIAGSNGLGASVLATVSEVLAARIGESRVVPEAREMRARLVEANAASRANPWSLKHAEGGLMEIEFLLQALSLLHGATPGVASGAMLDRLRRVGALSEGDADRLQNALDVLQPLQQIERVALDNGFEKDSMGGELLGVCARALGVATTEDLSARLLAVEKPAGEVIDRLLPLP